jgi:hypothetical protein
MQNPQNLIPMKMPNGEVQWIHPSDLEAMGYPLNGLFSFLKSKGKKTVENVLPELQTTVATQSNQIAQFQSTLQQKDQLISQLNQKIQSGAVGGESMYKNPIFLAVAAVAVLGGGFSIYKIVTN